MLLLYALGLGIPFMLSALLMEKLQSTLQWFQNHRKAVDTAVRHTVDSDGRGYGRGPVGCIARRHRLTRATAA